jgi:hypothetical protein
MIETIVHLGKGRSGGRRSDSGGAYYDKQGYGGAVATARSGSYEDSVKARLGERQRVLALFSPVGTHVHTLVDVIAIIAQNFVMPCVSKSWLLRLVLTTTPKMSALSRK